MINLFEEYTPAHFRNYLNRTGLNEVEINAAGELITQNFFVRGFRTWRPGNCQAIPDEVELTNSTLNQLYFTEKNNLSFTEIFATFEARRYIHCHFYLTTNLKRTNQLFIFDPTGVPLIPPDSRYPMRGEIIPYFGLQEHATGTHAQIYREPKPLDNWGTRPFPPNFHP